MQSLTETLRRKNGAAENFNRHLTNRQAAQVLNTLDNLIFRLELAGDERAANLMQARGLVEGVKS